MDFLKEILLLTVLTGRIMKSGYYKVKSNDYIGGSRVGPGRAMLDQECGPEILMTSF